nr:glycosyltransferase family 2 protein [Nonomuraea mesophila]
MSTDLDLDYVLPLRWNDDDGLDELTGYLARLSRHARVIVVDGSPGDLFARHAARWRGLARHVPPAAGPRFANGKVTGVTTGLLLAEGERVVIADDDVRYDLPALAAVHDLLGRADLVRPQNYFDPLPWHARWDTARTLLNRAFGADYPGTFGVRRDLFMRMGGYDGDVLFENLELIRTVRAHGGREVRAPGLYVRRLPCDARRFWSQRVRQAYDDLAQPVRMAAFLAVLPALGALRRPHRLPAGAALAVLTVVVAEAGRRRAGGRRVFPATTSLAAPAWVLERAVCSWLALGAALTGGVPYAGGRIRRAAHSVRALRRRVGLARGTEAAGLVRAVAERLDRGQAAAAQGDRRPAGVDGLAVLGEQREVAPDEQGAVGAGRHGDRISHAGHLPQG